MNPVALPASFQDAVITEAVKLVEESGPLADAQAMRQAMSLGTDAPGRIVERARILGQRLGLQAEVARGPARLEVRGAAREDGPVR